jgi:hypothetical protein
MQVSRFALLLHLFFIGEEQEVYNYYENACYCSGSPEPDNDFI